MRASGSDKRADRPRPDSAGRVCPPAWGQTMFFIFGTRSVIEDREAGRFYCPACKGERQYVRKELRRDITLFFLRIMEGDVIREFIQCQDCNQPFNLEALRYNPVEQAQTDVQKAVKYIVYRMMMSDSFLEETQIKTIQQAYHELTKHTLTEADIRMEATGFDANALSFEIALATVSSHLNAASKKKFIQAGLRVATAAGPIDDIQRKYLDEIATMLNMTPEELQAITAEFE